MEGPETGFLFRKSPNPNPIDQKVTFHNLSHSLISFFQTRGRSIRDLKDTKIYQIFKFSVVGQKSQDGGKGRNYIH